VTLCSMTEPHMNNPTKIAIHIGLVTSIGYAITPGTGRSLMSIHHKIAVENMTTLSSKSDAESNSLMRVVDDMMLPMTLSQVFATLLGCHPKNRKSPFPQTQVPLDTSHAYGNGAQSH
jgi:hypothetical protein